MKAKKFVILTVSVLVAATVVLSALPMLQAEYMESSLKQDPIANGDFYYYHFSTTTAFYKNSSMAATSTLPYAGHQSGTILLTVTGNRADVKRTVYTPAMRALGIYNSSVYVSNSSFSVNSPFIQNFVNSVPRTVGAFTSIQNELGIVKNGVTDIYGYYKGGYTGSNGTLRDATGADFVTVPFVIEFPDVANASATTWVPYNVFNLYDKNGQYNILVESFLGGDSPFLKDIINGSITIPNATSPVVLNGEYFFKMELLSTNVDLGSLAPLHYMVEYLPVALVLWIIVMPSVYFTVVRKKKRR